MISFEHLFRSVILERGYDYYLSDMVKDFEHSANIISARVDGSSVYDVQIILYEDRIDQVFCTCPYFDDGKNCKHIAALFYKLNDTLDDELDCEEVELSSSEGGSLDALLNSLEKIKLIAFLKNEMELDASMKDRFCLEFQAFDKSTLLSYHLNLIDDLLAEYSYADVFVNYYQMGEYQESLDQITGAMKKLIESNDYEIVFKMIKSVLEKIIHIDADDSDGTTIYLLEELMSHLECVINNADEKLYNIIFEWASTVIKSDMFGDYTSYVFGVWANNFNSDELLNVKIDKIDLLIKKLDKSDKFFYEYELSNLIVNKIFILNSLGKFENGLSVMKDYIYLHEIRSLYIDKCIDGGEYESAIGLLIDGKTMFADKIGVVSSYSKKLIEIYKSRGQNKKLLSESKERLFNYASNSIDAYTDYKSLFDASIWLTIRLKVIESLKDMRVDIKPHLLEEELLDELIAEIASSPNYYGLWTYEKALYKTHSTELLQLFRANVLRLSESSGNRSHYRNIIDQIKDIRKYPDGQRLAKDLARMITSKYKNRSAMLDEFRKANI